MKLDKQKMLLYKKVSNLFLLEPEPKMTLQCMEQTSSLAALRNVDILHLVQIKIYNLMLPLSDMQIPALHFLDIHANI